jgi:hypothetical protein
LQRLLAAPASLVGQVAPAERVGSKDSRTHGRSGAFAFLQRVPSGWLLGLAQRFQQGSASTVTSRLARHQKCFGEGVRKMTFFALEFIPE